MDQIKKRFHNPPSQIKQNLELLKTKSRSELAELDHSLNEHQRQFVSQIIDKGEANMLDHLTWYRAKFPNVNGKIAVNHANFYSFVHTKHEHLETPQQTDPAPQQMGEEFEICQGMSVYTPEGMGGVLKSRVEEGNVTQMVSITSKGAEIWRGSPNSLRVIGNEGEYPFPALYSKQDDAKIARAKMGMKGQKPDKYEVQKATTPMIPTTWDAAEALKYAKNVVLCFHGYLEQAQGQMLTDKGFITAWADKLVKFKGNPWPNNTTVMSTLKAAATENWDFRETFYTFCRLTYMKYFEKNINKIRRENAGMSNDK